eukprot:1623426-Amphidinium_carterae.1
MIINSTIYNYCAAHLGGKNDDDDDDDDGDDGDDDDDDHSCNNFCSLCTQLEVDLLISSARGAVTSARQYRHCLSGG